MNQFDLIYLLTNLFDDSNPITSAKDDILYFGIYKQDLAKKTIKEIEMCGGDWNDDGELFLIVG